MCSSPTASFTSSTRSCCLSNTSGFESGTGFLDPPRCPRAGVFQFIEFDPKACRLVARRCELDSVAALGMRKRDDVKMHPALSLGARRPFGTDDATARNSVARRVPVGKGCLRNVVHFCVASHCASLHVQPAMKQERRSLFTEQASAFSAGLDDPLEVAGKRPGTTPFASSRKTAKASALWLITEWSALN